MLFCRYEHVGGRGRRGDSGVVSPRTYVYISKPPTPACPGKETTTNPLQHPAYAHLNHPPTHQSHSFTHPKTSPCAAAAGAGRGPPPSPARRARGAARCAPGSETPAGRDSRRSRAPTCCWVGVVGSLLGWCLVGVGRGIGIHVGSGMGVRGKHGRFHTHVWSIIHPARTMGTLSVAVVSPRPSKKRESTHETRSTPPGLFVCKYVWM